MATQYVITVSPKGRSPWAVQRYFETMTEAEVYAAENIRDKYYVTPVEAK